jgi:hypothetical protein
MAIVLTTTIPTRELYDQVNAKVGPEHPDGLIIHTASEVDGEVRVTDVWESAEAAMSFAQHRLGPAVAAVTGQAPDGAPDMVETFNVRRG